jgi:uncharacterized protein (UPF0262 family)
MRLSMDRLSHIEIDDTGLPAPTLEMERERTVAIADLLDDNSFALADHREHDVPQGPYRLLLCTRERRLVFDLTAPGHEGPLEFHLSLGPFRQVVKDYFQICESYFEAAKRLSPGGLEAIDMARRGIHNEGARVLQERLDGKATVDLDTARRLFTLICLLQRGGIK